jgi:hypothetical protein
MCLDDANNKVMCGWTRTPTIKRCDWPIVRTLNADDAEPRWEGCRVVYGDTDSLFVHMPGRSLAEAHVIGAEIAAAVTAANPPPVVGLVQVESSAPTACKRLISTQLEPMK